MPPAMLWQAVTTLLPQPVRHIQAADAVVAEDNQCVFVGLGFQLLQAGWDFPHGDQCGPFDARDGKFFRFANVNQDQRFPRVNSALDVFRAGFYWEDRFAHESEDSAVENCPAGQVESLAVSRPNRETRAQFCP